MKNQKKFSVVRAFKGMKRIVKDEYMLSLYESNQGSLENLKKANGIFDVIFISIQMRLIIWIAGVAIGILLYFYFRYRGLSFWFAFPLSFLLSYLVKKSLQLLGIAILERRKK